MDFYARTLRACTSPANGFGTFDYPAVLLALQSTPSTQTNIVHIGYLICNRPAGCPGNIPNDGAPHFVYTRGDNDAGSVWLLDTYYHAPVIGHQYRARISHGTSGTGNPIWLYCLRDLATEADYTCHGGGQTDGFGNFSYQRSWSTGQWAWWGAETQNINSQHGTGQLELFSFQRNLKYLLGSTWWIRTNLTCLGRDPLNRPAWFHCATQSTIDADGNGSLDDLETLQIYTEDRS